MERQPGTFTPLRQPAFALVMAGVLLTNLGNSIQGVGAAWHLTAQGAPADVVALVQTALNLPILLLALPAGAWADLHDRRRVILLALCAMLALSVILALTVGTSGAGAAFIIGMTALIACGIAVFTPAMGASIRSTVPLPQLASAVALNILIFNTARALGPALGGAIVAAGGAEAAFLVNAGCYALALGLFLRWNGGEEPPPARRKLSGMIGEGLRCAAATPEIRIILARAVTFTLAGAAAWALMPLVAEQMFDRGAEIYGLLLGALGLGAVLGAASATVLRQRFSPEAILRLAGVVYGIACIGVALQPGLIITFALLVIAGAGWVQALSGFSVAAQLWAPREVVGRIVAMASALTFGGLALGSWLWGHAAESIGIAPALAASGVTMVVLPLIGLVLPMPGHKGRAA